MSATPEILHRAEIRYGFGSSFHVVVVACPVIRRTPKGCYVRHDWRDRFVLNRARKKFAHSSPELAIQALKFRRRRQVAILEAQLAIARAVLNALEAGASDGAVPSKVYFDL